MPIFRSALLLLLTTVASAISNASPWIEPNNFSLRNDIQLLADSGVITAPVTTYPLMWKAIINDVKKANLIKLTPAQQIAVGHVLNSYKKNQQATSLSMNLATTKKRFTSFGDNNSGNAILSASHKYSNTWFSGKLAVNKNVGISDTAKALHENDLHLDGSYGAILVGNWIVSAGATPRWWGPSQDTNLIMSTNARPLTAVTISRNDSSAFETPWLNWLGPWTFTAQMAQLESKRTIAHTKMWSARSTIRPFNGLEIGTSWSFQWGGEGLPNEFGDFFNALAGKEECTNNRVTCDEEDLTTYGNHIAGYDIRFADSVFGIPYAVYTQQIGEDRSPGFGLVTDKAKLYGAEIRFTAYSKHVMLNLEYSDAEVACGENPNAFNCFYEHGTYQSGYRYYSRSIGSTYDNDAKTLTATALIQQANGSSWLAKLRYAKLNTDDIDRSPDSLTLGNNASKVKENVLELDNKYSFKALSSDIDVGLLVSNSSGKTGNDNSSKVQLNAYINWLYLL